MSFSRFLRLFHNANCAFNARAVLAKIITCGLHPKVNESNHLLSIYLKSNCIEDARKLFDQMPERDVISWTMLISGYLQMGMEKEALNCFRLMVSGSVNPNDYTYVAVISACASIAEVRAGKEVHGRIYRSGLEMNGHVGNCLVNMYGKCGFLKTAKLVFDQILTPNSISWTSLFSIYFQHGENVEGLKIFSQSRRESVMVNEYSCASVFSACTALGNSALGKQMHTFIFKYGFEFDKFVVTGLINCYVKGGELDMAYRAFLEVGQMHMSSWTALIGGYSRQGKLGESINLFLKMLSSGLKPGERTFSCVLGAFADSMDIKLGQQFHSLIIKMGFSSFVFVGNAVLGFYARCGLLEESVEYFDEMDEHDIISWNALISGLLGSQHLEKAVELLKCMLFEGYEPNSYTYSSLLNMCSDIPAIEWGKQTHCRIVKSIFDSNVVIWSALVDMYAKCGRLTNAQKIFDNLALKNLVSWNTMLVGYAQHGLGREALEIYSMMKRDNMKPNDITFIGVLSACAHVGLVEEGWHHFTSMIKDHGVTPRMEHIGSMVSLFARKGQTRRAYECIRSFPIELDKVVWRCLLSGCKIHKDFVLGRYVAEKILSIDPEDISAHIMLSNIYAEAKMWDELAQVRKEMKQKALKKDPGYSWTELRNKIYSFSSSHYAHCPGLDLHLLLHGLTAQLIDAGYVPDAT